MKKIIYIYCIDKKPCILMYIHVHLCAYIAKPKTSYGNKLYNAPFKIGKTKPYSASYTEQKHKY